MENVYTGSILLLPFDFTPRDCLDCRGQLLQIHDHQQLFVLLGTRFGGDGKTTFGLPNMNPPNREMRYVIVMNGVFPPHSA